MFYDFPPSRNVITEIEHESVRATYITLGFGAWHDR